MVFFFFNFIYHLNNILLVFYIIIFKLKKSLFLLFNMIFFVGKNVKIITNLATKYLQTDGATNVINDVLRR